MTLEHSHVDKARLQAILDRFASVRVLVVGDLILDEFVWGRVSRISPEAPVPVVWVQSESFMPGGAANVAHNLAALGAQVQVVGAVGADVWGERLVHSLKEHGVGTDHIVVDPSRPTTCKTRVIAHHQQVVRIDREQVDPLDDRLRAECIERALGLIDQSEAVVIEDYGKGVAVPALLDEVVPTATARDRLVVVDPKEDHFEHYKGVTAITPNQYEAGRAVGIEVMGQDSLHRVGEELLKQLRCQAVLVTLGEEGMCLFESDHQPAHIATSAREVYDVSGAGDTVVATFTLAAAAEASMLEAAFLSNEAAGLVVEKVGIGVATQDELSTRLKALESAQ